MIPTMIDVLSSSDSRRREPSSTSGRCFVDTEARPGPDAGASWGFVDMAERRTAVECRKSQRFRNSKGERLAINYQGVTSFSPFSRHLPGRKLRDNRPVHAGGSILTGRRTIVQAFDWPAPQGFVQDSPIAQEFQLVAQCWGVLGAREAQQSANHVADETLARYDDSRMMPSLPYPGRM
jgi:hypothetical protein